MNNVLYVEDNDDNIYMLKSRLELAGFNVDTAIDGESGVRLAAEKSFDLIIMDLILPGIDGWESCRRIKARQATAHVPIIALSSNASTEDRTRSLLVGCVDFDTKPVDFNRLMRKIKACLN